MIIHHIRPFATDKNIGKCYNKRISELPEDCYIALSDGDTMYLTSDWGVQIEQIIKDNPSYDVITCMTNRIANEAHCVPNMFDEDSILKHMFTALDLQITYGSQCIDTDVAPGLLMIFHKSIWHKHKFKENSIIFDRLFSNSVIKAGGKIGLAKGLYLLHLYRYGKPNPKKYKKHLL